MNTIPLIVTLGLWIAIPIEKNQRIEFLTRIRRLGIILLPSGRGFWRISNPIGRLTVLHSHWAPRRLGFYFR